ncbi:MAG: UDP-glucose 4-epimerase [Parcubacteria group bacterium Gr01-1014_70]|nr:MAG: UDP-glucose 4-epimerase [Parcubacteria group bacterium Gr01-1014_70]
MSPAILVTGCAGFIGSNFVREAKKELPDVTIVGIDDFSTGRRSAIDPSIVFYEGSILDEAQVEHIFSRHKPFCVVHFAAIPRVSYSLEHPRKTTEVNVVGTVALLEASMKHSVRRFVYSSSSSLYGGAHRLPTKESENMPNPKSPYAMQKYAGEPFCKIFSDLFGIDTISLRYFNVFGPGQYGDSPYSTVISAWLEALYFPDAKKAFIEGDGEQTRDFCYVDNVVRANMLAVKSKDNFNGEVCNIAHGERTSANKIKEMLEIYTGKKLYLEQRPPRKGDVRDTHADISKAKDLLGYEPLVRFDEGLKKTISWFEGRIS